MIVQLENGSGFVLEAVRCPCQADRARWYARKTIYFCTKRCAAAWALKEADRQAREGA